jgi:type VI protein secretion system component Hcp
MLLLYLIDEGGNVIRGEHMFEPYQDWIEIESIDWNSETLVSITKKSPDRGGGSRDESGENKIAQLTFIKRFDRASPILYQKCIQNELSPKDKLLQKAVFHLVKAVGFRDLKEKFFEYGVLVCEGVRITKWQIKNSLEQPIPTEDVSISFDKVTIQYTVLDPHKIQELHKVKGQSIGHVHVTYGWNYLTRTPYALSADEIDKL